MEFKIFGRIWCAIKQFLARNSPCIYAILDRGPPCGSQADVWLGLAEALPAVKRDRSVPGVLELLLGGSIERFYFSAMLFRSPLLSSK